MKTSPSPLSQLQTAATLFPNTYRTHHCNELREEHVDTTVRLAGFVHSKRDHGGLLFIMLRDQYGLTQLVVSADAEQKLFHTGETLRLESTISISGTVTKRSLETINAKLATGSIEVALTGIHVLNKSAPLPFEVNQATLIKDESIEYRYLYLRRMNVKTLFLKRSALTLLIRNFLTRKGFCEIETPLLTKTTPEGARDFLVPSRVYPGEFYALPQSPQQYKQLLMAGGFDKYFQLARALRDEDSRADRQAEHTQLDMEMAFVTRDNIIALLEELICHIHRELFPEITIPQTPFPRLSYQHCLERYGSDKPDLRFGLELHNVSEAFAATEFKIFQRILSAGGSIRALAVPDLAHRSSRKELDAFIKLGVSAGLKGLVWAVPPQNNTAEWRASSGKVIAAHEFSAVQELLKTTAKDLILLAGDSHNPTLLTAMGELRKLIAGEYKLIPPKQAHFAFVIDYPLLQYKAAENRYDPLHHMFVLPKQADIPLLDTEPAKVTSTQFDMVANGYELCSGSERIYNSKLQRKVMRLIGLTDAEIDNKFAHLLRAFDFGTPPHGGAAPGLDRLLMVFSNITNIREVIAFPKTQRGQDLMMGSPSPAAASQLRELALNLDYTNMKAERAEYLKKTKAFDAKTF